MLCARPLAFAVPLADELDGGGEVFTFVLDNARTIHVESEGPADTFGVLYAAAGRRLLAADDGGLVFPDPLLCEKLRSSTLKGSSSEPGAAWPRLRGRWRR